jgi:hypothetical protein
VLNLTMTFQADGKTQDGVFVAARNRLVAVEVADETGVRDRFSVDANKPLSRRRATKYGPSDADVIRLCDETRKTGAAVTWSPPVEPKPEAPGVLRVTIRDMDAPTGVDHDGTGEALLHAHLAATGRDKLLAWRDRQAMLCLDIDYHNTSPPPRQRLEAWVESLRPRPVAWHFSRGGGAHLFYVAVGRFTGDELAAAAALRFRTVDASAGLDLVTQVRGAGDEPIRWSQPSADGAGAWLPGGVMEPGDPTVDEWLETHGLVRGQRYEHDKCPMDPGGDAMRQPVVVLDAGVFCYRCAARGISLGSRKPGLATYSALAGVQGAGDVGRLVTNKVHWGQARWVLTERYDLPESLARLGYAAALKAAHEDMQDDEVAAVFRKETLDMARSGNAWMNLESSYYYPTSTVKPLLGALPACQYRDDKQRLRPSEVKVAYMLQGHTLDCYGYDNLRVIHGFRMTKQYMPATETQVGVLAPELRGSPRAPRYLRRATRKPVEWAEGVYERLFPGISWPALRMQVCAAGVSQEMSRGLHPLSFIAGPSGSSKTSTVKLAAGMLGASATEVTYNRDTERFKRAIADASGRSAFALCNEFVKEFKRENARGVRIEQVLDVFLTITPETTNHVLHVGPRPLGRLPAITITEPSCPLALARNQQVARRFRLLKLYNMKSQWKQTFADLGLGTDQLHLYRLKDAELAEAADVIMSDLVDRYFSMPGVKWDDMADSLGVPTIDAHPDFESPNPLRQEFYRLVCEAPELEEPRLKRKYAAGYKRIHSGDVESDLVDIWNHFCDGQGDAWGRSQRLEEADWNGLIGVPPGVDVQLDVGSDGAGSVYVRFRVGPTKNPVYVNETIPRREA